MPAADAVGQSMTSQALYVRINSTFRLPNEGARRERR